jgi:hypothetical protein
MDGTHDPVAEFVAVLRASDTALDAAGDRLAALRISDGALGKLFEAHAVRDAYHARLPQLKRDFDEACQVLTHIVADLEEGRGPTPGPAIPHQNGGAA